jgi:hypothetical protein
MQSVAESIRQQILELPINNQGRRVYPKSIKFDIRKLYAGGMDIKTISEVAGIHPATLNYWCSPPKKKVTPSFKEVPIRQNLQSTSSVEIHLVSGLKITGLSATDVLRLLQQGLLK